MIDDIIKKIAPTGVLRVGVNMSNFLLVNSKDKSGVIDGVSPGIGKKLAKELNISFEIVQFANPGLLADAVDNNEWDIGNIASEKERGKTIDFSDPYVNIDANFLFREEDNFKNNNDIDQPGIQIAVFERSAYDLWLSRNIQSAELVRAKGLDASYELFVSEKLEALAGLSPKLMEENEKMAGSTILPGQFTAVQQSIGCGKDREEGLAFLVEFVEETKTSGFVADLIEKHGVVGRLSVAPPA